MNKQAEHYEKTGDALKGEKALSAYRAAQNHLQPTDDNYMDDVKRLQDKIATTATNTWGGLREGAGRPATGAMPNRTIRMTDEEYIKVKEFLKELRASQK